MGNGAAVCFLSFTNRKQVAESRFDHLCFSFIWMFSLFFPEETASQFWSYACFG